MKRLATPLLLMALILTARSATAAGSLPAHLHGNPLKYIAGNTIPEEWAGVWQNVDSTYDCSGVLQGFGSSTDTLCANTTFQEDPTYNCTIVATANSFQMTCTGSGSFEDCTYTIEMESHGTRSGDSYFGVTTISTVYSGPSDPCDLFPDNCTQFNSHGTRTGPADPVYCATPTLPSTWGALKSRYR